LETVDALDVPRCSSVTKKLFERSTSLTFLQSTTVNDPIPNQ